MNTLEDIFYKAKKDFHAKQTTTYTEGDVIRDALNVVAVHAIDEFLGEDAQKSIRDHVIALDPEAVKLRQHLWWASNELKIALRHDDKPAQDRLKEIEVILTAPKELFTNNTRTRRVHA